MVSHLFILGVGAKVNTVYPGGFSGSTVNDIINTALTQHVPNLYQGVMIMSGWAGSYNQAGGQITAYCSRSADNTSTYISGIFVDWQSVSSHNHYVFSCKASSSGAISNLVVKQL